MGTQHTPGPWRVEEGTTLVWGACNPDDRTTYGMGYPVASMEQQRRWDRSGEPTTDTQDANARLIAAAPDLLAACEAYAEAYDAATGTIHVDPAIRAAIARAKGEA